MIDAIGKWIETLRIRQDISRAELLGLTQAQLADGICGVVTVSRMERGSQVPHQWTREQLMGRLGISPLKYDGGIVTEDYADFERLGEVVDRIMRETMSAHENCLKDYAVGWICIMPRTGIWSSIG